MPSYELSLILKTSLTRPELVSALKRSSQRILQKGGIIRNMENLGQRELPYRMYTHSERHTHGSYFIIKFDSSVKAMTQVQKELMQDSTIVRNGVVRDDMEFRQPCLDAPCQFGELKNLEHERTSYRKKVLDTLKLHP